MNGRRAIVGLCMLCALLASAFAAQSASAITGTTAVTCAKTGGTQVGVETFHTSRCLPGEGAGEYEHYQIAQNTNTETATTASGPTKFKATLGGVATTFTSTGVSGTGLMVNNVAESGEHYFRRGFKDSFEETTISPFTKCFVYKDDGTGTPGPQGVIETEELVETTLGQGHGVKITPEKGSVLAKFWILDKNKVGAGGECAIHGTYNLAGTMIGTPEGASLAFTHAGVTTQNTLKIGTGEPTIKAGFEGGLTLEGRTIGSGTPFTPISYTTVTT